jgi:hypothetical protein
LFFRNVDGLHNKAQTLKIAYCCVGDLTAIVAMIISTDFFVIWGSLPILEVCTAQKVATQGYSALA